MFNELIKKWGFEIRCASIAMCLLAMPGVSYALEAQPSYHVFELKPGEKINSELTLTNNEDTELQVTPMIKDWFITQANKKIKTVDWLKTDTKPFTLKAGEKKIIKFSATAPKQAVGEVMGMLSFNTKAHGVDMVSFRLSLSVYVAIQTNSKKDGEVLALSVNSSTDTYVSYLFANRGNTHLRPKGLIQIFNDKNEPVLNVVYDSSLPTQPGKKQVYQGRVKNYRLEPGRYRADIKLEDADWNIQFAPQTKRFEFKPGGKIEGR